MLDLKIPTIKDAELLSGETQFCTNCQKEHPIEHFGWRYCYVERLKSCKRSRNIQAKKELQRKKFEQFNKVTRMSWQPNELKTETN